MAFDTVVDGVKLNGAMTATANAIRDKSGSAEQLVWDQTTGFKAAVDALQLSPSVSSPPEEKDINFFDYDGTLLYSFTLAEAWALTALPPLPEHDGLVCQGWNWTLEEVNAANRPALIGPNYDTIDGSTKLHIDTVVDGLTVTLYLYQSAANDISIDWGDGSATSTHGTSGKFSINHVYEDGGKYEILLSSARKSMELGDFAQVIVAPDIVREANIGSQTTQISAYAFDSLERLERVSFSQSNKFSGTDIFDNCRGLRFLSLPKNAPSAPGSYFCRSASALFGVAAPRTFTFGSGAFMDAYSVRYLIVPDKTASVPLTFARAAYGVAKVFFPPSVSTISANAFANCTNVLLYDFSRHTSVPSLANVSAFTGINANCKIRVPSALYNSWSNASNWATYAANIVGV